MSETPNEIVLDDAQVRQVLDAVAPGVRGQVLAFLHEQHWPSVQSVKQSLLAEGDLANQLKARAKKARKELLVWVGKKSAVWGPWALGAVGTVGHFILGLF